MVMLGAERKVVKMCSDTRQKTNSGWDLNKVS